mgnify:CR=1 FL=1
MFCYCVVNFYNSVVKSQTRFCFNAAILIRIKNIVFGFYDVTKSNASKPGINS